MADYDITTAEYMFKTERYVYVVFMCHLAIEKMMKAIIAEASEEPPPMTHNLIYLMKMAKVNIPQSLCDFVAIISNASIPTRYPIDFLKLIESYPEEVVLDYLNKAKEVLMWLKKDPRLER